jgi:hypothetical protein
LDEAFQVKTRVVLALSVIASPVGVDGAQDGVVGAGDVVGGGVVVGPVGV